MSKKKICLNCGGNWDICNGHECVCLESVCCDFELSDEEYHKRLKDREYSAFGYKLSD